MTPEREALAAAIDSHRVAIDHAEQCEQTLQKARDLLAALAAQAAEFDGLDDDIACARAETIKSALVAGEPPLLDDEQSGFARRRIAREHLVTRLNALRSALIKLEDELADAERCAAQCEFAVEHAAERVLIVETEAMAAAHLERLAELRREHYVLANLAIRYVKRDPSEPAVAPVPGHLYGTGGPRRVRMPPIVADASTQDILGNSEQKGGMRVRDAVAESVAAYWDALKQSADARLDDPEPSSREPRIASFVPRRTA